MNWEWCECTSQAFLQQASRIDPEKGVTHSLKEITLNSLRRCEDAIQAFKQAILLDPENGITHYLKEKPLNDLRYYEDVIQVFEQTIQLDSEKGVTHSLKGITLTNLGHDDTASIALKKANDFDNLQQVG